MKTRRRLLLFRAISAILVYHPSTSKLIQICTFMQTSISWYTVPYTPSKNGTVVVTILLNNDKNKEVVHIEPCMYTINNNYCSPS